MRKTVLILSCLLALLAGRLLWPAIHPPSPAAKTVAPLPAAVVAASAATNHFSIPQAAVTRSEASTNREFFRLTNTPKTVGELTTAPHAILLENALVDTTAKLDLKIPTHLRAKGAPGAYIVQARGVVDAPFRALLAGAGAQIVSYIPNNAYLVQLSAAGAAVLSGDAQVQAVLPFEPYFKVQSSLLGLAVQQKALPPAQVLTLGLFASGADTTLAQIEKMGGVVIGTDRSPFGPVVRVRPPMDWLALAQLPGVQRVEPARQRTVANDLARAALGISTNTLTMANWLNLSGSNVVVEVNDTGIDTNHPDMLGRVMFDFAESGYDTDGHGTHVAGIIAANGYASQTVTNASGSIITNLSNAGFPFLDGPGGVLHGYGGQFRGKAPLAKLLSVGFLGNDTAPTTDLYLQETPALTNALISNNSWVYGGDNQYDLAAASYDAAVRDALPETTGPQPVLFVFAAGNNGAGLNGTDGNGVGGLENGSGGQADTILSPATAKNVITVGALEQFRYITNIVTAADGTSNAIWQATTDTGSQIAYYSSRGNVGVQTEGQYGRFKPDVVAPGTFVVSTRSTTWDEGAYYNPTNYHNEYTVRGVYLDTNTLFREAVNIPNNAVSVSITARRNNQSPTPFPDMPLCISMSNLAADPTNASTYDILATANNISIPPRSGGSIAGIGSLLGKGFTCAVRDGTNIPVNFDLIIQIATTNDLGNQLTVLSNLNNSIGTSPYYYRYESGTSMAAPAVSGALALMQDYFTNTLHTTPSPALLKAMLINGARLTTGYNSYGVNGDINYEGWGLVNVPNSVPLALSNGVSGSATPMYFLDQSPTNVLATGDRRTFAVNVPTAAAQAQMLHITLAWTDPPGNPAAGIKLVNNLDLMVSNKVTGAVYYGNTFASAAVPYSVAVDLTNTVPDSVNNVENVILPAPLSTDYSVTVIGRNVTVNAVTAEQTNIVQDYALVISCGDGANTSGITVTPAAANIPSTVPLVTFTTPTNQIYFNEIAGANAPWLSTNAIALGANSAYATNASLFIGQTNQWHFFVVTNTTTYTNAAFITFLPNTLATPRMGVFANSTANSTRPEADLDLFVAQESTITNLDPVVISNCVFGVNGDSASLDRGGTEFVAFNNSQPNQVYYIGVQCQDQMAGQFAFFPVFSLLPFSQMDTNGNEIVNGVPLPVNIPDGDNAHPGVAYVFGLATIPMDVGGLTVTNTISHQNFGDLFGTLTHDTAFAVLNNHEGLYDPAVNYTEIYDDDGTPGTKHTDGPGSLQDFRGNPAIGPWILTEMDDSLTQTGSVNGFTLVIHPHQDLTNGTHKVTVQPKSWWYGYVDVTAGFTNLTVFATNQPPNATPPIQMYLNYEVEPNFANYLVRADLTNSPFGPGGLYPGNVISYGPPLMPGRYFVGLYNPSGSDVTISIGALLLFDSSSIDTADFASTGSVPLLDDAVTYDSIFVPNKEVIQNLNVGLRVDHPRISDLVFHLISPDGTRYLLMENRGGQDTNGCGRTVITTNIVNITAKGGQQAQTNVINMGFTRGTFPITYDFYTLPDEMTVYYGTNIASTNLILDTGMTNNPFGPASISVKFPPSGMSADSTYLTIVMNQYGNPYPSTAWTYTAGGVFTNYYYLSFTEDTNLTTTPIKFASPPLVPLIRTDVVASPAATNLIVDNLYYQAEQWLGAVIGTSAAGEWQLEVLDNRAGATNNATLVSWQLEFTFANTNLPVGISGFVPQTNTIATNSIQWYQVYVPTNASYATNILDFATAPVNLWYSDHYPPAMNILFLGHSTAGSVLMNTNTTMPLLVPGSTYYLGVQNTNSFAVTNAIEVDFDHGNQPPGPKSVRFNSAKASASKTELSWAPATGSHYQIQWKNNLSDPWQTVTNPAATVSNGVATFSDDGSQTAPLGGQRFYRLVWVP